MGTKIKNKENIIRFMLNWFFPGERIKLPQKKHAQKKT